MNKLLIIIIWLVVLAGFIMNIYEDGIVPASIELVIVLGFGFLMVVLTNKFKWKFVRLLQIVGFGSFFIFVLFGSVLPFKAEIFIGSIVIIIISILVKHLLPKKELKTNSLEERVKSDLKITSTTIKKRFPKVFNRIGGLVIPALPFVSFINKDWKKQLDEEAVIHENVHLYYLQNGWILGVIFVLIAVLFPLSYFFSFVDAHTDLFSAIVVVFLLVHFEYITFNKTNKIADGLGIITRRWNRKLAFTYLILYAIQITIILSIIQGVKFVIGFVGGLV